MLILVVPVFFTSLMIALRSLICTWHNKLCLKFRLRSKIKITVLNWNYDNIIGQGTYFVNSYGEKWTNATQQKNKTKASDKEMIFLTLDLTPYTESLTINLERIPPSLLIRATHGSTDINARECSGGLYDRQLRNIITECFTQQMFLRILYNTRVSSQLMYTYCSSL